MAEHAWIRHIEPIVKLPEDLAARLSVLVQHGDTESCARSFNSSRHSAGAGAENGEFQFFQLMSPAARADF
jgi:uncharacterized protein YfiM (DUF2279 family)